MNNISKLLSAIVTVCFIMMASSTTATAQEAVDKLPSIKGGIGALAENIVYPSAAKEADIEGKVFVEATIDENGRVIKTEVTRSVSVELDAAAVNAVMLTEFIPAEHDGHKVKATVTIPINFKLDDCKEDKNGTGKKS